MLMRHPDVDGVAQCVSRRQFDAVYGQRGWELVDEQAPLAPAPPTAGRTSDVTVEPTDDDTPVDDGSVLDVAFPVPATVPHEGPTPQES